MQDAVFAALKKALPGVRRNIPKKLHTTFRIGGPAEYFFAAQNEKQLVKALKAAKKMKLPVFVLGGGSNLLVADQGVKGLVVKIKSQDIRLRGKNVVRVDAGVSMETLVNVSIGKSLAGVAWAGGLPGTVGGAVRGNAGAFGGEIKDSVLRVRMIDDKLRLRTIDKKQCQFSYRSSVFKSRGWIVVWAELQLKDGNKKELREIAKKCIAYRQKNHPLEYPSAGSIFKGVPFESLLPELQQAFADKVKNDPFPVVPAAWFIIGAALTGIRIGGAEISTKHSNYVVNVGNATAEDVRKLIALAQEKVRGKYGVELEIEVQFLGFGIQ